MGKIYVNQPFRINATVKEELNDDGVFTPVDISGLVVKFNYVDPNGATGEVTGEVVSGPAGTCKYDVPVDTFTVPGKWTFWAVITFVNGDVPTEPEELILYKVGF